MTEVNPEHSERGNEWWQSDEGILHAIRLDSPAIAEMIEAEGLSGDDALKRAFELREIDPLNEERSKRVKGLNQAFEGLDDK